MDYKNIEAVLERNTIMRRILAKFPDILSEAEVRDLSKSLANLRLKSNIAVKDDFLRYKRMFFCNWILLTINKVYTVTHSKALYDSSF